MSEIRARLESYFESLAHIFYRYRILTLIAMVLFIGFTASYCRFLTVDTSTESMLRKDDPSLIRYNDFRDQFGRSDLLAVLVESPDIFERDFLIKLKKFQDELQSCHPYIKKITSLINVRDTYGKDDALYVEELIEHPETADLATAKAKAMANPFYKDYILSDDFSATAVIIETKERILDAPKNSPSVSDGLDDGFGDNFSFDNAEKKESDQSFHYINSDEQADVNKAILSVIGKYTSDDFITTFSGGSVVIDVFNRNTVKDTKRMVLLMLVVILSFLYLMFHRVSGMFIPSLVVVSAALTTMGFMGMTHTPISIMTNILPGFLIGVCIADSVHVLAIFYRNFNQGATKEDAICHAIGHSGLAIAMTSLTTAAGLLSFAMAEIATIGELGIFSALGVMLGLVFTIILLPAMVAVIPIKRQTKIYEAVKANDATDKLLLSFGSFSIKHPYKIVAISTVIIGVSFYYIFQLHFVSYLIQYFPKNDPVKVDLKNMEDHLGGSINLEVLFDTKKENGIQDPDLLKKIDALTPKLLAIQSDELYVGQVMSIIDIIKETNQALHNNDPAYYKIPDDRQSLAQQMLLFETSGSEDLMKITDSLFSQTRLTLKTKWADSAVYNDFVGELEKMCQDAVGDKAEVVVTGLAALMSRTVTAALLSMAESYVIALIVITILLILLVGDIKLGLISMFPNLMPIVMVFGLISVLGVSLDLNTLFIGSVALGLVVDATIHFVYNYRKYLYKTGDFQKAIRETFLGTGRAILITTIVLSMNFFVLLFSSLRHSIKFGLFTGIAIVLSLLSNFVLLPALLALVYRFSSSNTKKTEASNVESKPKNTVLAESA